MTTPPKTLLIDPFLRAITERPFPLDNAGIRHLIGTDNMDHMVLARTLDHLLCGFCDGAGYYKQPMAWSRLAFYPNPLPGRIFIYAADEHGENADLSPHLERLVRDQIQWLDAEPELPPITVNGEVVIDFNAPDRPKTLEEAMRRMGLHHPKT